MSTESVTKSITLKYFDEAGFAGAGAPSTIAAYRKWLEEGRHGTMDYLKRHEEIKARPELLLPGAKSWISVLLTYDTQEPLSIELRETFLKDKAGWIARYARGGDYHVEIRDRLNRVISELREAFPGHQFVACVDTKPVLEREVAQRAGLGWIGKNTCLINQNIGSFVFLGEILTTLELQGDRPVMDHCGTCTRCLDACPTGALLEPRKLDATKCISYWTIETNLVPPPGLSEKFGHQFFGCDICQDVCPWNQKSRRQRSLPEPRESGVVKVEEFLNVDLPEIKKRVKKSAMNRAKPEHLKRNADIVLKNLKAKS